MRVTLLHIALFTGLAFMNQLNLVAQPTDNLDGNSYKIELFMKKGNTSSWREDRFSFDAGQMVAATMKKKEGFGPAGYSFKKVNAGKAAMIEFTCANTNRYGSKLIINGTVDGNFIEGTAAWTSDRGTFNYTFKGFLIT